MAQPSRQADIVFVGAGSAGLSGAVRAGELGLKAVVLEKLGSCGGDTLIAAGFWLAGGTRFQRALGIEDSADGLYRYLMEYSSYRCRPDLIRVLADRAAPNLEWLESQGLTFQADVHAHGTTSVRRVHQNVGMGPQYVKVMKERAEQLGAEILLKTGAKELILEGDRVAGVVAETAAGDTIDIRARGVGLTAGGFGKNDEWVGEHLPFKSRYTMVCAGWARGDGVRMARQAGADIADLDACIAYKAEMPDTAGLSMRSFYLLLARDYVVVNQLGERFMDESIWNAHFAHALNVQPNATAYAVLDETMRTANPFYDFAKEVESGRVKKAGTFAELARAAGLPADAFAATLDRYNAGAREGQDREFGKAAGLLRPLENPPYYAVELVPLILNTVGGPRIDARARVLGPGGAPVPGLYAAGNNTAGFYDSYPSTGMGLQMSSIFGQVAAEHLKQTL
ncbi:MAG: FAD-binding protein [Deltaproteobacteria bacterium]|nr:FAD-binding protein [Deltaproteobacteria bacterium]